jgi:E3 Ubiquitin ligase
MITAVIVSFVLAALATFVLFYMVFHFKKRAGELEDDAALRVGDIYQSGEARVVGKVVALDKVLRSPITRSECVYYRLEIEERRGDSDWETVLDEVKAVEFAIKDSTGKVTVDGKHLEVDITSSRRIESGYLQDLSRSKEDALLDRYGDLGLSFTKKMRYRESAIEVGDRVAVSGEVTLTKNENPRFRSRAGEPIQVSDTTENREVAASLSKAKTSLIFMAVSGGVTLILAIVLIVMLVNRNKEGRNSGDGLFANNSTNGPGTDNTPGFNVPQFDAEGLPTGNSLDSILVRLNHQYQKNDVFRYQIEIENLRIVRKQYAARSGEVFRTLRGHAGNLTAPPAFNSIPPIAWRQMLEWATADDSLELFRMFRAERLHDRQLDLFHKIEKFQDPRCAEAMALYLTSPEYRNGAEEFLKKLDPSVEKFVLPFLAANYDKDTRVAALQILLKIGTKECAKYVEPMTRDNEPFVKHNARIVFEKLSKDYGIEQDLMAVVKSLKDGIAAQNPSMINDASDQLDKAYRADHPLRAEVLKGLIECLKTADPKNYAKRATYLGITKWSSKDDIEALCGVLVFTGGDSTIFSKLKEYKDPKCVETVVAFLANGLKMGEASAVLVAVGAPAEKAVFPYTLPFAPNGAQIPFGTRLAAIEVLGEIGTKESVLLLRQLTTDRTVQAAANKSLAMVTSRIKNP